MTFEAACKLQYPVTLIVSAIERRDGEMAETLMRHHIRASRDYARNMLKNVPLKER